MDKRKKIFISIVGFCLLLIFLFPPFVGYKEYTVEVDKEIKEKVVKKDDPWGGLFDRDEPAQKIRTQKILIPQRKRIITWVPFWND